MKIQQTPFLNHVFYDKNYQLCMNEPKTDVLSLLNIFKEKIMFIYREILFEGRIFIVCREKSIKFLNQVIQSLKELFRPLNFERIIIPFETLSGLILLKPENSFVAGFNNPIVKNSKIWTLYVDLDTGLI